MSGIVGIYSLNGQPVESITLKKMVSNIAHRGPDGVGFWQLGPIGLGHCMLYTTPESLKETLPLIDKANSLALTADARLDNRAELISLLGMRGHNKDEITDSDLIIAAYQKWGKNCVEKLLGDFVFAIWDGHRQQLFCARDHMGIKPFFYYYQPGRLFIFASEIKALLDYPGIPRRLYEPRIADHLTLLLEEKTTTFYQDILRLPPAHTLVLTPTNVDLHTYWALDPERKVQFKSDDDYASAFRELFTDAVACRLRSAYPLGTTLSGGLDSSSIACVADKILTHQGNKPLHTFSFIFDEVTQCDERPYIYAVLAHGNFIPHYLPGDQHSPLIDLERVFWHLEEASIGPSSYLPWQLSQTIQQAGVRVVLDGFDGDTIVSHGAAYLNELAFAGQWDAFASEAMTMVKPNGNPLTILDYYGAPALQELAHQWQWNRFAVQSDKVAHQFQLSRRHVWWHYGLKALAPQPIRQIWRKLRGQTQTTIRRDSIVNPNFARRVGLKARLQRFDLDETKPPLTLREDHWRRVTSGAMPLVMELSDRTAAAFGLDFRHPFMDKRLVEFCLALPPNQKLRHGWTRWILRQAMAPILPAQIQLRSGKANFNHNFVRTLLAFERKTLDEVLLTDSKRIEAYVDMKAVRAAYHRLTSQQWARIDDAMAVWNAVTLSLWLRHTGLPTA
jgi:asparagine synthase (glutamine-hydrolysing)